MPWNQTKPNQTESILFILLHTVKWFQLVLFNSNNSIYQSFINIELNCFNYRKFVDIFIWPINGILTNTTTRGQSFFLNNGNERVLYILDSSRTEASPSEGLLSNQKHSLVGVSYSSTEVQSAYSRTPIDRAALNCYPCHCYVP